MTAGSHLLASGHGLEQVDGVPAAGAGGGQGRVDVEGQAGPGRVHDGVRAAGGDRDGPVGVVAQRPGQGHRGLAPGLAPDVDAADRGAAGDARAGREVEAGPHHDDQTEHAEAGDQQPSVHPGQEVLP